MESNFSAFDSTRSSHFKVDLEDPKENLEYNWNMTTDNKIRKFINNGGNLKYSGTSYAGRGIYFNGVDQYIDYGTNLGDDGTQGMSLCFTGLSCIASHCYDLWVKSNGVYWYNSSNALLSLAYAFTSNNSYVITANSTDIKIYENGVLKASTTTVGINTGSSTANKQIGKRASDYLVGTLFNVVYIRGVITPEQIIMYYRNPEEFLYRDSLGNIKSSCNLTISDIKGWFPLMEHGRFAKNMITYTEGSEGNGVTSTIFGYVASGGNTGGINTSTRTCTVNQTVSSGQTYMPQIVFQKTARVNGEVYRIELDITVTSGTVILSGWQVEGTEPGVIIIDGVIRTLPYTFYPGKHYITIIGNFTNVSDYRISVNFDGTQGFPNNWSFTYSIKQVISGLHPVINYTSACKDNGNAKNLTYGLQTLPIKRTNMGEYSYKVKDRICLDGVGYIQTPWFPVKALSKETFEMIITKPTIPTIGRLKFFSGGEDSGVCVIETAPNDINTFNIRHRAIYLVSSNWVNNKVHILCTFDGSKVYIYINGVVQVNGTTSTSLHNNAHPVKIGAYSANTTETPNNVDIILFKTSRKYTTPTEAVKRYNYLVRKGVMS